MFGMIITLLMFQCWQLDAEFHVGHRASCKNIQVCNGNMMCAMVCERGSVEVDQWAKTALDYQHKLQRNDQLLFYEMPSTHNSAITEAEGFGIEKYFISALHNGENNDQGDDIGEGVCQYLSLTDQLNMGVRHLEIDLWPDIQERDLIVCHSPVPLYQVGEINRQARAANLSLEWDPKKMSCTGTRRDFTDVLSEINDWMQVPEHKDEIVILYFDTKVSFGSNLVQKANDEILSVFGDMIWRASEGNPLKQTVAQLLQKNKRIMIENNKQCWSEPNVDQSIVFYPVLWTHQFDVSALKEFPDCSIQGDSNWYGTQMVRALSDQSIVEAATRCGVQLASVDYINPDDMKLYVWSWDQQQPKNIQDCTAMTPSGRWATMDCNTKLSYACISNSAINDQQLQWTINLDVKGSWEQAVCPDGSVFGVPHNGYSNNKLLLAAYGQFMWLNAKTTL